MLAHTFMIQFNLVHERQIRWKKDINLHYTVTEVSQMTQVKYTKSDQGCHRPHRQTY